MPLISDIFDIPVQVHQGDFVLRLTEGVERPAETLSAYVVTPQLVICFDQALSLIKSAIETRSSKGAYLHGSFGSGKSHFMAVLTLLLQRHPEARAIPELASVVTKHNAWTQGRQILVVPYHMIGAVSLESAVLGQYAEYVRRRHPEASTPGFYQGERLFADARRLRMAMGDEAFFTQLSRDQEADSGWGSLGTGWDADSFEAAMEAPPTSDERIRLVGDLVDAFFQAARDLAVTGNEGFVALDEGLSIMSKHAQALGYDAVVLFLDELILWLASHAGDLSFINREGQKVAKLVEAMTADRPIPIVSFIARQRDLRELVGEHLPGAEHLGFADVLNWWEARFDQEGRTPSDDRAKVLDFQATGESSNSLVWLPYFLSLKTLEDLGRLVLLDHILSGNNLNQNAGHLSQVDREQARVLLHNQRDQMRQRMRNAMLAAYGISTMHLDAIDTSHDLEAHFISLNPALTLQPPVGATLRDAMDHLFSQALAQQFPAHPAFDMEIKPAALRRVRDVIRQATQTRDGRVEVERPYRDEVRRIAVPLRLGDMGETHFVLRDDWKSHFLRKKAEENVANLTVRRLRAWLDQPEAMGLRKDIQDLVVFSFALQNNLTFYLHGGPVEPALDNLDDALELREQALPSEGVWLEAAERAAAILGIAAPPLLSAASVARFVADVKTTAEQHRQGIDRLCSALRQHLGRLGIDAHSAPRLQTGQAALAFIRGIAGASADEVVAVSAQATVATSAAAMGESLKKADDMSAVLENTSWELFDKIAQLPRERAPQAPSIVERVKDALRRDEHVVDLKRALKEAQSAALELLTSLVKVTLPPPPAVRPPVARPPAPQAETTGSQRAIDERSAATVFETIRRAMASDTRLVLDIEWHLYRQDGQS